MDDLTRYERYLEKELAHCDSRYALCQEMAGLTASEMTALEHRQEHLLADLERLREARKLFSPRKSLPNYDYTPSQVNAQERALQQLTVVS